MFSAAPLSLTLLNDIQAKDIARRDKLGLGPTSISCARNVHRQISVQGKYWPD